MTDAAISAPTGFHIMVPPGWGRYTADDVGKRALISRLSERMKEAGRPDLDAQARTLVERQWRQLQKTRATAVYLPGRREDDALTPMSIATRQFVAPRTSDFARALRAFAKVDLERIEVPWGETFRWTSRQAGHGRLDEVHARMIGYGFPVPGLAPVAEGGPAPRGILFITSIPYLDETASDLVDGLVTISDAIMDTFRWRE